MAAPPLCADQIAVAEFNGDGIRDSQAARMRNQRHRCCTAMQMMQLQTPDCREDETILTIYFDTNIYRYISAVSETRQVATLLSKYRYLLKVSSGNLFETFAIEEFGKRFSEMDTIVQLGRVYEEFPESYLHALEVRRQIKQLRPGWMTLAPPQGKIRAFLKHHRALWNNARFADLPAAEVYAKYSRDAERGVATEHLAEASF